MREKILFKISSWAPPLLWAIVIFLFSSLSVQPAARVYWQDFLIKKTAHVIEYGILAVLLYRALRREGIAKPKAGVVAILISIFYGVSDEFHQGFTPGREPRARDVAFDTIGAIGGAYLCKKYW